MNLTRLIVLAIIVILIILVVHVAKKQKTHSIEPPKPTPSVNRFHGWWNKLSKGGSDNRFVEDANPQMFYIDATDQMNITLTAYGGTAAYAYQFPDQASEGPFALSIVNNRVLALPIDVSATVAVSSISGTFPDDKNYYLTIQEGGEFDGLISWAMFFAAHNNPNNLVTAVLYEKLNSNITIGEQIRPWGDDAGFTNSNSRRFMFEQINQNFFENGLSALGPAGQADIYMQRPERLALFDKIMNHGVTRNLVTLYNINQTQMSKNSGTTTLLIKGIYSWVNFASKIRLSNLKGPWAMLNNHNFQCAGIYNTSNASIEKQTPFYLSDSRIYYIVIIVDTSALPPFNSQIHTHFGGAVIIPSKVGPITETIEYREWIDAAIYYITRVIKINDHTGLYVYLQNISFIDDFDRFESVIDARLTKPPLATWSDVSQAIVGTTTPNTEYYAYTPSYGASICPVYYLPYWITAFDIHINEPFLELGIPGSTVFGPFPDYAIGPLPILGFNVPFENYLLPSSRRWPYFRIKPDTPVTNAQQENVWVCGYDADGNLIPNLRGFASVGPDGLNTGGQLGGSRLEALISTIPWGLDDPLIVDDFWSPYGGVTDPSVINIGIVNPAHVGGRKIGYISFAYDCLVDPFGINLNINFGDPALALSPDPEMRKRQQYDGQAELLAAMMRYFTTENVEVMYIDNRCPGSGIVLQSFPECFGGVRKGMTTIGAFQSDEQNVYNIHEEIDVFGGTRADNRTIRNLKDTDPFTTVRPDLMEQRYPGSVFKNGPVIILNSEYAYSFGNIIQRYFMGNNLDGDLGSVQSGQKVQAYFVGTMNSIITGADLLTPMIRSRDNSEFPDVDGIGQSPVDSSAGAIVYWNVGGVPNNTRRDPHTGQPIKALIPVNSNLKGPIYKSTNTGTPRIVPGALSSNIGDTVYFDFGYTGAGEAINGTPYTSGHWDNPPHGIDQISGFPGQPDPYISTTLRDSWFEEGLRVARLALGDTYLVSSSNTMSTQTRQNPVHRPNQLSLVPELSASRHASMDSETRLETMQKLRNRIGGYGRK